MGFRLIDAAKAEFATQRMCGTLGVSQIACFCLEKEFGLLTTARGQVLLVGVRSAFAPALPNHFV